MADVFVSYSRDDRETTAALARALENRGWSVWWDPHIRPGVQFDRAIETEITRAGCVLVVWSRSSVNSDWVRAEASAGLARGCLVSATLELSATLPLRFTNVHTESLEGWSGNPDAPVIRRLCDAVEAVLKSKPYPETGAGPRPAVRFEGNDSAPKMPVPRRARWAAKIGTVLISAVLVPVCVNVSDRILRTPDRLVFSAAFVAWACGTLILVRSLRRWY